MPVTKCRMISSIKAPCHPFLTAGIFPPFIAGVAEPVPLSAKAPNAEVSQSRAVNAGTANSEERSRGPCLHRRVID